MPNSYHEATGDGSTRSFNFTFTGPGKGYLNVSNIKVYVGGVLTNDWSLSGSNTLEFTTAPADDAAILIRREMDITEPYSSFSGGNQFGKANMNNSFLQQLYTMHELFDGFFTSALGVDLDLGGNKIINVADATDNTDLPNFGQMKAIQAAAEAARDLAQDYRDAAEGFKNLAEQAKTAAEAARDSAQTARGGADTAKAACDSILTQCQQILAQIQQAGNGIPDLPSDTLEVVGQTPVLRTGFDLRSTIGVVENVEPVMRELNEGFGTFKPVHYGDAQSATVTHTEASAGNKTYRMKVTTSDGRVILSSPLTLSVVDPAVLNLQIPAVILPEETVNITVSLVGNRDEVIDELYFDKGEGAGFEQISVTVTPSPSNGLWNLTPASATGIGDILPTIESSTNWEFSNTIGRHWISPKFIPRDNQVRATLFNVFPDLEDVAGFTTASYIQIDWYTESSDGTPVERWRAVPGGSTVHTGFTDNAIVRFDGTNWVTASTDFYGFGVVQLADNSVTPCYWETDAHVYTTLDGTVDTSNFFDAETTILCRVSFVGVNAVEFGTENIQLWDGQQEFTLVTQGSADTPKSRWIDTGYEQNKNPGWL